MGKLTAKQVLQIRKEAKENPALNTEYFGKKYKVSISTIAAILKRETWRNIEMKDEKDT